MRIVAQRELPAGIQEIVAVDGRATTVPNTVDCTAVHVSKTTTSRAA